MSRGFGKYRRGASHHSFQFDSLFKENSNRPSAARSAASVGKWGITSFTSIRKMNGRQENDSGAESAPKPKKFFKSRDTQEHNNSTPSYSPSNSYGPSSKRSRSNSYDPTDNHKSKSNSSPKKFFSSKNSHEKVVLSLNQPSKRRNSERSDSSDTSKPPIVLRICRGKSQIVSDAEESDKAATPNSTASTSPRALRENASQGQTTSPRPTNCRITRSARRSMQMEPSSSPVTTEPPVECPVFPLKKAESPKKDLSPQYVPAEKFEEERRALYASLLKSDSPKQAADADAEEDRLEGSLEADVETTDHSMADAATRNSVEAAMAAIHGLENNAKRQSEPSFSQEEDMELEEIATETQPPSEEKSTEPEETVEMRLARMEAEFSQKHYDETIENIGREIDKTKTGKNGRELRRRGKQKDAKDDRTEHEQEEVHVTRPTVRENLRSSRSKVKEPCEDSAKVADKTTATKTQESESIIADTGNKTLEPIKEVPSVGLEEDRLTDKTSQKATIENEWTTDSDSNSTAPEPEVKPSSPTQQVDNVIEQHKDEILDKILEKPPEPPPVKLVISKKKGSIFKSRALVDDAAKKRRPRYVHKWIDDGKGGGETPVRPPMESTPLEDEFDFTGDLTRVSVSKEDQDVTSVKCTKSDKSYYMVIKNVKKAHQIQEIGEFQEFNDDVEYILDALQDNNPVSTRCLSAITLASKCMAPAFRMHVRAHGTVAKFFKALHDACRDQSLGLCTATVMFVLSQDRLNMDLDRDCLELMLNLLESDVSYQQALDVCGLTSAQLEKNKQKVRELCADIQSQGHAMHLNLENITTGQLAMETLLSLTSKRAGEWFKEELRELGGLEHIMKTIRECCRQVSDYVVSWTDALLDKLKKVDRCLRVLENVTQNNEENQTYILKYNDGMMVDTLVSLYKLCDGEIPLYPVTDIGDKSSTGAIIREALLVTLKVLINLTHHYRAHSIGSQLIGSKPGIVDISLHLLLQVPHYIPDQKKFELGVLVLMFLINLIQDQETNKKLLIEAKAPSKSESIYSREESAVEALIVQFYEWEACARIAENKTNAILDGEKDDQEETRPQQVKTNEEFIEETVAKLLQKAGTHMEFTLLASYIVMLVGFLIMDNDIYQRNIRQFLKGNNFKDMVELLKKFFNFMNLTASTEASSVCAVKATQKVIKFLESCDPAETAASSDCKGAAIDSEPTEMAVSSYL